MSTGYDIRRARRDKERQRALCGESIDDYRRRAAPTNRPGDHLGRARCVDTFDLFGARNLDLFTDSVPSSWTRAGNRMSE